MSAWISVLPPFAGLALVLLLPGVLVGWAAGLRRELRVGMAPLLSVGVVGLSSLVCEVTPLSWGVVAVGLGTVVVAGVLVGLRLLEARRRAGGTARPPAGRVGTDLVEPRGADGWLLGLTALSAAVVGLVSVRAMGSPLRFEQGYDAAFHVNALWHVYLTGEPGPVSVGSQLQWDLPPAGNYPPGFADLGALVLGLGARDAVVASNLTVLALSVVAWPCSVMALVRLTVPPSRGAWALAMAVATATAPAPYLLMVAGAVWPTHLSVVVMPAMLAAVWLVVRSVRGREWRCAAMGVALVAVGLPGIYLAHPGAVFMLGYLLAPLACWLWLGACRAVVRTRGAVQGWVCGLAVLAASAAAAAFVLQVPAVARLRQNDWGRIETVPQAIGEVATLAPASAPLPWSSSGYPAFGAGLLVALGAVVLLRRPRPETWLVGSHLVVGATYVVAAAVDGPVSQLITGFWYNDRYRIAAHLGITIPVLTGWGAVGILRLVRTGPAGAPRRTWASAAAIGATVLLLVVVPLPRSWARAGGLVRVGYAGWPERVLTTPQEEGVYRSIPRTSPEDSVIGPPFAGATVAGPLSWHRSVFGSLHSPADKDRIVLKTRFKSYQEDPEVCRIVQRLRIRFAVEDESYFEESRKADRKDYYRGVVGLAGIPGFREIRHEGGTRVYEVAPCRA